MNNDGHISGKGARTLVRDGFTLVEAPHPSDGRSAYTVIGPDGAVVGLVATYSATMEIKRPGKRYVNRRWTAERWYAQRAGEYRTYKVKHESASAAAKYLLAVTRSESVSEGAPNERDTPSPHDEP